MVNCARAILSDEAAGLVRGLGLVPWGNIGDNNAVFEPVHGTAPDIAGKGIANPISSILSASMMLDWLGEKKYAKIIEGSVLRILEEGRVLTPDLGGTAKTFEVAKAVIEEL
jgi:isocitrate/isopropylmalate dehydrogenase